MYCGVTQTAATHTLKPKSLSSPMVELTIQLGMDSVTEPNGPMTAPCCCTHCRGC